MSPKGHALLSASSSDRWLHCPPSARLCETYEDKGSDYAAEGTDAHALCEYKLRKALGMEATDPTKSLDWYNAKMEDCATGYASFIMELLEDAKQTCSDPVVLIEQRVDFSRWVEQGFGTSDAILISDGTMHVIDYKHGLGILVSAEDNPQMKCYALGALELFDDIYDIDTVSLTIYQPRRQNVSTYDVSKDDLYQWADEVLKPTADLPLPVMEISCAVNGADSARQSTNAGPEQKPIFYSHSTISNNHLCWKIQKSKLSFPMSMNWSPGPTTSRSMHFSRQSAVKNGQAGNWSRVAPTADIPTKTPYLKLSKLLVLTLMKRSYLVSLLCKSYSANLASRNSLQPILKSHKANLLLCRKAINARQ